MAFATIKGARILSLFKCPCNYKTCASIAKAQQRCLPGVNAGNRKMSSQCGAPAEPACGKPFKSAPCGISNQTKKDKLPQPAPPRTEEPEIKVMRSLSCCGDPCPDVLPRFDKLYYRRSDKLERSYPQTWDECAEMLIKPQVLCCRETIKPKFKKRSRKERPQTACKQEICLQSKSKCPHINMPNCKVGRHPPACLRTTKASNCQKRQPPYPAFSECKRAKSQSITDECSCLVIPSICEVWAYYHRQHKIKKPVQL